MQVSAMSDQSSVGIVETRHFTFAEPPHEMVLESGEKLGPITLAYETYGELNHAKSNAVLILHALSGDAHAAGRHSPEDPKPGWWDNMIGPGKAFDTDKYFIICANVLGGCRGSTGPCSLNPVTGKPYGLDFPVITIGDMVRAQRELIRYLGISRLLAVAGGSMGGMQALEWATRFPNEIASALVIAATPVASAQAIAFDAVGRNAIQADDAFASGNYYDGQPPWRGLAVARMLGHITYLSDESMQAKFGRRLKDAEGYSYDFGSEFSVETYLDYQGGQFVSRFDANSYLYITKAIDYFDLADAYGSLDEAFARVTAKMCIVSFSSDWLYPPYQSEQMVYSLARQRKNVTYCNIRSDYGHDAFLLEGKVLKKLIAGFLEHVMHPARILEQPIEVDSEADSGPPPRFKQSIYEGRRVDYDLIVNLVDEGSRVLDVGCGDGELLVRLARSKRVEACGIELAQGNIISCVRRGAPIIQADAETGLGALPDQSYDFVILSMTLQVVREPERVLNEMLRVGRRCIVSFPNFGYWRVRAELLLRGRAPVTRSLPYPWHTTPNRHVLSIKDFRRFCRDQGARIEKEIALGACGAGLPAKLCPNFLADEAVFVITRERATPDGSIGSKNHRLHR